MNKENIGKFIAKLRKEKKWTQDELAQRLVIDRATISKWERGLYIPNVEYLIKMQEIFDISVNEILYGERKNKNNNKEIETLPLTIMSSAKKKIKKILIGSFICILLLLILFLSYYFINNYNSVKVYKIYGSNSDFYISDGIMILSKEKAYIKLGNIGKFSNKKIDKVRFYFKKENKEHDIFLGGEENSEILLVNRFDYNELFEYKDIEYILKGLYLEITTDNVDSITLNLTVHKDFANINLFNNRLNSISLEDEKNNNNITKVSDYVKNSFTYDKQNEKYYKISVVDKYKVKEEYFYNIGLYLVTKIKNDIEYHFEYYIMDKQLNYNVFKNAKITDSFVYDFENDKCEINECNLEIIQKYKEEFLNKIFE